MCSEETLSGEMTSQQHPAPPTILPLRNKKILPTPSYHQPALSENILFGTHIKLSEPFSRIFPFRRRWCNSVPLVLSSESLLHPMSLSFSVPSPVPLTLHFYCWSYHHEEVTLMRTCSHSIYPLNLFVLCT